MQKFLDSWNEIEDRRIQALIRVYKQEIGNLEMNQALGLISDYEREIAGNSAKITAIVATPEHDKATWRATFDDDHQVWFWVNEHQQLLENRVNIVQRTP